jgi:hypothetical protein
LWPCWEPLLAVPFHAVPAGGRILTFSICMGSALNPGWAPRCRGGKSLVLGSPPPAGGIGEGWEGTLFAAQSGRAGNGCCPGWGCWICIEDARREERDEVVEAWGQL